MSCPRNSAILRALSGELAPDAQREMQNHLETCPHCRSAYEDFRASWDALGAWRLELSAVDLTERVLTDAEAERQHPVRPVRVAGRWSVPLRAAASIILAVGLGVGAGHLVPAGGSAVLPEPATALESIGDALDWIGIDAESATGLPGSLEPDEAPAGGEVS